MAPEESGEKPDAVPPPAPAADVDAHHPAADDGVRSKTESLRELKDDDAGRADANRSLEIITELLGRLRDAPGAGGALNVTLFTGRVDVGRDFTIDNGGAARARRGVTPIAIASAYVVGHTQAFVEPPGFPRALRMLAKHRVVVLAAPPGIGQYTAALELLRRASGDGPDLYELPAQEVLGDPTWAVPHQHAGFVIKPDEAAFDLLSEGWLSGASRLLTDAGSYLVVLTGKLRGELENAPRRAEFVLENLAGPDPLEIVKERVAKSGLFDAAEVADRLGEADVRGLLDGRPQPWFAVRVAEVVVATLRDGGDLGAALAELDDPASQVKEWFETHESLEQVAFAFAVAVLGGSTYLTLSDAATQLRFQLSDDPTQGPLRFRRDLAAVHPWVELVAGPGEVAAEVVRFRNPRLQPAVLSYVWYEFDNRRPKLLTWLRKLAGHADVEVRARAGTAVGIIAAADLTHALHRYLLPWGRSGVLAERQSAALALGVIGSFPEHSASVWQRLRAWSDPSRGSAHPRLAETAGLVVGGPLGLADPEAALDVLRGLAGDEQWRWLTAVALGAQQLVNAGALGTVLATLLDWTGDEDNEDRVAQGLIAFAFAARFPVDEDEPATTVVPVRTPGLPMLLANVAEHLADLAELWARALENEQSRPLALDALREWLRLAEDDASAYRWVLELAASVADRGERDSERLEYYLEQWAEDEEKPSASAADILDELSTVA
ncbi:hypothetical protein [Amycolatopsis sp. H20-H5]|uniref:hypothetical protein n=1 Tax=Amycolatopsis sp. H20-H5 TaxID=3046309 RepID=UPI002DBAAB4E|nr:hypothetical protein [Amycolatopsis sp. H20-H5]MEC3975716.1 hypothetical protein [Amycolatopsis sp. H20-H5]